MSVPRFSPVQAQVMWSPAQDAAQGPSSQAPERAAQCGTVVRITREREGKCESSCNRTKNFALVSPKFYWIFLLPTSCSSLDSPCSSFPSHTLTCCTHMSVASSSTLASRASSFFGLRQSCAKWSRTPPLKHLPIDDLVSVAIRPL
jgi:hypothetical protein